MSKGKRPKSPEPPKPSKKSTQHEQVGVDTSFAPFRAELFALEDKAQFDQVLDTIDKVQRMTWEDIYRTSTRDPRNKRGLNWEPLDQMVGDKKVASIRVTDKFRARVVRDGRFMRLISLHPDHDSAYG